MYRSVQDPYCYAGSSVLRNLRDLRRQSSLDQFEAFISAQRADEPLPHGRLSLRHYQAVHRHLFQDVYHWAGRFRTVRLAKDGSAFCYPEYIKPEMVQLFADLRADHYLHSLAVDSFAAKTATFLANLNAIHPFREGNGRAQTVLATMLAARAGHPLDLQRLEPQPYLSAMIKSFRSDLDPLTEQIMLMVLR